MTDSPLISAPKLAQLLATNNAVVLLDARSAGEYAQGHLRGARPADVDRDLSDATAPGANPAHGGRHPLPAPSRWTEVLGNWGIGPETMVVAYDDQAGANAAARAWWMLRAIGHTNVFVLDGGLGAALDAGMQLTTGAPAIEARPPYPAAAWHWPTVAIDEVEVLRADPNWRVLDVRSAPRYRGETEPIDPIAGHIPGAINLPFSENLAEGRFKSAEELRRQYETLLGGLSPDRLVVHCGSGVTACHTLLALDAAGLNGAALFVGSWSEWCRTHGV